MKDDMNFDDFEQFLQDEANNHKMFPSDHVWNSIAKQIQPKKYWPALTIVSSVIVLALSIATFLNYPPENILDTIHATSAKAIVSNAKKVITTQATTTQKSIASVEKSINVTGKFTPSLIVCNASFNKLVQAKSNNQLASASTLSSLGSFGSEESDNISQIANTKRDKQFIRLGEIVSLNELKNVDYPVLDSIKLLSLQDKKAKTRITQEKILQKLEFEVYTTPSISYRSLDEDQINQYTSSSSVNGQVSQKAGLGSELGLGLRYKLSKDITLKAGIQFNIRQYYIDAYQSQGLATINFLQNNKFDSVNVASKYSNGSGVIETKLTNRLYQVSLPIGLEWKVLETRHIGFNLGVSIQPTYSLNRDAFIISTDYKYYANGESLFRKWNINSSLSANFTYIYNKSTFFIGPQVRYQHLPTYVDKYPIKEYRVDYGIRLGIIRPFGK